MPPFYENKQNRFECFLSKDITFPAHLHDAVEIIFIKEGELHVTVQNHSRILKKHDVALAFPNLIHSYSCAHSCLAIICIFAPAHAKEYYHLLHSHEPKSPFFDAGTDIPPYEKDIPLAFERMLLYASGSSPATSAAWLNLILTCLLSETPLTVRDDRGDTDIVHRIISYISLHFKEPLSFDLLAKKLHFNKYYISRVFAEKLNCSFYEYINRLRLDFAARQLKDTALRITDIWQEAGFESQKTFNRNFLACYHMTPSQYRKVLPPIS